MIETQKYIQHILAEFKRDNTIIVGEHLSYIIG